MPKNGHCFKTSLLASVPRLRAFAIALCASGEDASDLVQDTLVKAWAQRDKYVEDKPIEPWLYTILRNNFYSQKRKSWREVSDIDGCHSGTLSEPAVQSMRVELNDINRKLMLLPADQREAFVLVCVSEMSYEEAALYCECPIGTIRSRVNRARKKLRELLDSSGAPEKALRGQPELAAAV